MGQLGNKKYKMFIQMPEFIAIIGIVVLCFFIGLDAGHSTKREELEQKLCQLKQYEYCTK